MSRGLFVLSPVSGFSGPSVLLCNRVVVVTVIPIASVIVTQRGVWAGSTSAAWELARQAGSWLCPDLLGWSLWACVGPSDLFCESDDR